MQRSGGNTATTAFVRQRQFVPAPAGGQAPSGAPAPQVKLPEFKGDFLSGQPRFRLEYKPVAPLPTVGVVNVTVKVHVEFKNFTRAMMRGKEFIGHRWTKAQLADFDWPRDEQEKWTAKFGKAVKDGWSEKRSFVLRDPTFAPYKANCKIGVEAIDTPEGANTVITAQWVPRGAPRLRSAVGGNGSTATLDARDVDTPITRQVTPSPLIRQVGPFEHDSDEANAAVTGGVDEFAREIRKRRAPGGSAAGPGKEPFVTAVGRSTSPGAAAYNRELGLRRANKVLEVLSGHKLGLISSPDSVGEEHASKDPKFRRVDLTAEFGASAAQSVTQNTAAHEFGHMVGLGDEYVEEQPPKGVADKFLADKPTHYEDVRRTLGDDAANDLLVQDSPSIMSTGGEVKPGHYVYFLDALNGVTGKNWTVE